MNEPIVNAPLTSLAIPFPAPPWYPYDGPPLTTPNPFALETLCAAVVLWAFAVAVEGPRLCAGTGGRTRRAAIAAVRACAGLVLAAPAAVATGAGAYVLHTVGVAQGRDRRRPCRGAALVPRIGSTVAAFLAVAATLDSPLAAAALAGPRRAAAAVAGSRRAAALTLVGFVAGLLASGVPAAALAAAVTHVALAARRGATTPVQL